jgi:serine/threonine protein kinase
MSEPVLIADRYELSRKLGKGAHGIVYAALDRKTGEQVAIKVLGSQWQDPDLRHRFENEAKQTIKLQHPHIVRVSDFGEHKNRPYLVMELLSGDVVSELLKREQRLLSPMVVPLLLHAAQGLAAAHAAGVVHRDIKPENLFLVDGQLSALKILDFGIAKASDETRSVTQTGAVVGTPGYIAPERLEGSRFDGRSDVFSLGAVGYLALTGQHAYSEGKDGIIEIIMAVLNDPLIAVRDLAPETSPALAALIERMLSKDPAARPSAEEVARAEL